MLLSEPILKHQKETIPEGGRFLTCSVLPVRMACNLDCKFCFSKSSVSALDSETADWGRIDIDGFYQYSKEHGANRLVITGGGEPLLRPELVVDLVERGAFFFDEIALFTNGSYLSADLSDQLREAGLGYICFSRHHHDDTRNRELMGASAVSLEQFFQNVGTELLVRATCVMCAGTIDSRDRVWKYIETLREFGVREFTFKHTYRAYQQSVFRESNQDRWVRSHQIEFDPFEGEGHVVATLPWGPKIRQLNDLKLCYYYEPTPHWERINQIYRSSNLLSDGRVFASLEDQRSLLYRAIKS